MPIIILQPIVKKLRFFPSAELGHMQRNEGYDG